MGSRSRKEARGHYACSVGYKQITESTRKEARGHYACYVGYKQITESTGGSHGTQKLISLRSVSCFPG